MNGLAIEEQNETSGMDTKVVYYTLPGENVGALVRVVSVTNRSVEPVELELLDGMPAVIPYGVSMDSMKNMGQTAKAWMQVEDLSEGLPYYRVRASMDDTAAVAQDRRRQFLGMLRSGRQTVTADCGSVFDFFI